MPYHKPLPQLVVGEIDMLVRRCQYGLLPSPEPNSNSFQYYDSFTAKKRATTRTLAEWKICHDEAQLYRCLTEYKIPVDRRTFLLLSAYHNYEISASKYFRLAYRLNKAESAILLSARQLITGNDQIVLITYLRDGMRFYTPEQFYQHYNAIMNLKES